MEIRRFINSVLRKLWLIVLLSAIGGGIAWYLSVYQNTPVYQAESTLYAMNKSKAGVEGGGLSYQDMIVSRQLIQDFSEIVNSQKVTSLALNDLKDLGISQDTLRGMVSIELKKDSSVVGIHAVSSDPKIAATVANAVSRAFIAQIRELTNSDVMGVLDEAKVPQYPLQVNSAKSIVIGILAGLSLAFVIIYIIELFDTTVRVAEDVEYNLKLCVIGIIPEHNIR